MAAIPPFPLCSLAFKWQEKSSLKELWSSYLFIMIQNWSISPSNAHQSMSLAAETYHFLMLLTKQRHWHPKCFRHSPDRWYHSITPKQAIKKGLHMWDTTAAKQMVQYLRKRWPHEQRYLFLSYDFYTSDVNQAKTAKKQKQQPNNL